jgi:hypothetical protein
MVNGYASNPNKDNFLAMLSNNNRGEELCYYGELYLYKESENTGSSSNYEYHMGYSRGSDLTFTCEETGYYYICINRDSYASLTSPHYSYSNYQPRYTEYDSLIENYIINRDWYYDAYCNIDGSDITGDQTFENPYYNSENEDSPSEVTVTGPVLFNFTPDWDGTEDGAYTGTTIESHAEDTNGNWLLNQNKKIPYRWGNVYYHMFLSTN